MNLQERERRQQEFEDELEDRRLEQAQKDLKRMVEIDGMDLYEAMKQLGIGQYEATFDFSDGTLTAPCVNRGADRSALPFLKPRLTIRERDAEGNYTRIVKTGPDSEASQ